MVRLNKMCSNSQTCDKDKLIMEEIKLFHVFDDKRGYNVLFVTNNDCVYGLGSNGGGSLGFGHNLPVRSQQLIPQLCDKNIRQFITGVDFVLAITDSKTVYGWGINDHGQLARPPCSDQCLPKIIEFFTVKNIHKICCGYYHSLALTSDGRVYAWGQNMFGQIGCTDVEHSSVSVPKVLGFSENCEINSVYCSLYSSFAITTEGRVFSWGRNHWYNLGHNDHNVLTPRIIPGVCNVQTVRSNGNQTCFLTRDGFVYICGQYHENELNLMQKSPIIIPSLNMCMELDLVLSHQNKRKSSAVINDYNRLFEELAKLNAGEHDQFYSELNHLVAVRSEYVVKYIDSWFEGNLYYIQMELCSDSLRNILKKKLDVFPQESGQPMNCVEYYISCEIFRELLQCVQYLHELSPQIIHRDLKPDNILVSMNGSYNNGNYFKLCDFGLAAIHDKNAYELTGGKHSAGVGTVGFQAPEVSRGLPYNHLSDVFSLSKIGEILFDLDISDVDPDCPGLYSSNEVLNNSWYNLVEVLAAMYSTPRWELRPECSQSITN
ncbi:unnamed protein product [Medioppia subpectinata]|uniref:Protein kinase domain-containing protein n=1 Tax=Medioppia subpectinata TaxID=1979941 RepID=A0A7R9PTP7_9ACAR|nr:unnamed protein product [Medioppia subpectinata]CAG2100757.1 unnamed protein product [Medioppia subpectinata]